MGLYRFPVTRILICGLMIIGVSGHFNYREALSKSILFFEGQRSGKLPTNQRITWRSDSGLSDGSPEKVDLSGGYYVGGDNTKFGLPMAYSITMLAWSVIEYGNEMGNDLQYAREAIRWGTDYLLKTCSRLPDAFYIQVGDPKADHDCWQRPEDIDTPKKLYKITSKEPNADVPGETAAALAAASIVFKQVDPQYSTILLETAKKAYEFARTRPDKSMNDTELKSSVGCPYYCSDYIDSDEVVWAAAWLFKAAGDKSFSKQYPYTGLIDIVNEYLQLNWEDKYTGVRVLLSKYFLVDGDKDFQPMAQQAVRFICRVLPDSPRQSDSIKYTTGGLMGKMDMTKLQFATSTTFLFITFAKYLEQSNPNRVKELFPCRGRANCGVNSTRLIEHAKSQVDYILGQNKYGLSYMVGFGEKFPKRIHHRASSLPSVKQNPQHIGCKDGFSYYFSDKPNPNNLTGAIVSGPDEHDKLDDRRNNTQSEPGTYINAPFVGTLAYFASKFNSS